VRLTAWTNYEAPYLVTTGSLVPTLSPGTTFPNLQGTYPPGVAPYTNIIIDVYQLDPEGWADGIAFAGADWGSAFQANALTDGSTYTNGFAQANKYIGSFTMPDNSGTININLPAAAYAGLGQVTITANYSADAPGTHNGRVQTSNFSNPITLGAPIMITSISSQGTTLTIQWAGGRGPFNLQRKSPITGAWVNVQTSLAGPSTTYTEAGAQAYYRISGS
jgi:hypothetical protein